MALPKMTHASNIKWTQYLGKHTYMHVVTTGENRDNDFEQDRGEVFGRISRE